MHVRCRLLRALALTLTTLRPAAAAHARRQVGAEPPGPGGFSIRFLTTIDSLDGHYILKKHLKRLRGLVRGTRGPCAAPLAGGAHGVGLI
jgi:hypothetical protein